jgi:hypothetical protein
MGHWGNPLTALQDVVISLFAVEELRRNMSSALVWPLMPHEATVWQSRQAKVDYLLSAENANYTCHEATLPPWFDGKLELRVERRNEA